MSENFATRSFHTPTAHDLPTDIPTRFLNSADTTALFLCNGPCNGIRPRCVYRDVIQYTWMSHCLGYPACLAHLPGSPVWRESPVQLKCFRLLCPVDDEGSRTEWVDGCVVSVCDKGGWLGEGGEWWGVWYVAWWGECESYEWCRVEGGWMVWGSGVSSSDEWMRGDCELRWE